MSTLCIKKPHALLVPMPFQGHFTPAVNLAVKLSALGFAVTFVNTETNHHNLTSSGNSIIEDIFGHLDIRYELVGDGLSPSSQRAYNDHDKMFHSLYIIMSNKVEKLLRKMMVEMTLVTCLIADVFFVWPSDVAEKFGLPFVTLWTQPATVMSLYYHVELMVENGHFGSHDNRKDTITYIPGIASIEPTELISHLQEPNASSLVHQTMYKVSQVLKKSNFVLCNTVQELELETIKALHQNNMQYLYPIGPISHDANNFTKPMINTSLWPQIDCTKWLDSKPQGSVLYVSFGSIFQLNKSTCMKEIASGVLASKVSFVWVLRPIESGGLDADFTALPDEFNQLSEDKGIVVSWCNQREVLMHSAIGRFLTHCGWNSILEGISCGVPMLCFALFSDQFTNRKLVVNVMKYDANFTRLI